MAQSSEATAMITMTQNFIVLPKNRREFLQTISALIVHTRKMKGCLILKGYHDSEDENSFVLISEWESQGDLDNYIHSEIFEVLLGTKSLLAEPFKAKFDFISNTAGMEMIRHSGKEGTVSEPV